MKKILFLVLATLLISTAHAQSESYAQAQLAQKVSQLEARLDSLEHKVHFLEDKYDLESLNNTVLRSIDDLLNAKYDHAVKKQSLEIISKAERNLNQLVMNITLHSLLYHYTDIEIAVLDNTIDLMRSSIKFVRERF